MTLIETRTDTPLLLSSDINRCGTVIVFGRPAYVSLYALPRMIEELGIEADEIADEIAKALTHVVMDRTGGNYVVRPAHAALALDPDPITLYFVRCLFGDGETSVVTERSEHMRLFGLTFSTDAYTDGVPWATQDVIDARLAALKGQR